MWSSSFSDARAPSWALLAEALLVVITHKSSSASPESCENVFVLLCIWIIMWLSRVSCDLTCSQKLNTIEFQIAQVWVLWQVFIMLQVVTEVHRIVFWVVFNQSYRILDQKRNFWNLFLNSHQNRTARLWPVLPSWLIISLQLFHFNLLWINLSSPSSSFLNMEKHLKLVKHHDDDFMLVIINWSTDRLFSGQSSH